MVHFLLAIEILGTLAFAASGAMTGIRKNMDIFGVCILALTTAVGGGVIRDVILGNTPPATFQNPVYATVALLTALILFLPSLRRFLMRNTALFDLCMFWMDAAGLGIFTVTGIQTAYAHMSRFFAHANSRPTLFLLVFVGVVTGVGGGVLRDIMAGDTPYIFVKHVYASASLAGALLCGLLWHYAGEMPSMLLGAGLVILIRALSRHFNWNLPRAHD